MCADSIKPAAILSNCRATRFLILKSKKKKSTICGFLQIHSEFSAKIKHRLCCRACTAWKLSGRADSCHKSMAENFQSMFPFGCRMWLYNTKFIITHISSLHNLWYNFSSYLWKHIYYILQPNYCCN